LVRGDVVKELAKMLESEQSKKPNGGACTQDDPS
jgi:hypothetical protein